MDKIRLTRNIKVIEVNDAGETITLDFDDLNLPYRYYDMVKKLQRERIKFNEELAEKLKGKSPDEIADEMIETERRINICFRDAVDEIFSEGTCRKVYGDILPSLEMHFQFFDELKPFFEEELKRRQQKMNRYSAKRSGDSA